jgi:hypothetical protein
MVQPHPERRKVWLLGERHLSHGVLLLVKRQLVASHANLDELLPPDPGNHWPQTLSRFAETIGPIRKANGSFDLVQWRLPGQ